MTSLDKMPVTQITVFPENDMKLKRVKYQHFTWKHMFYPNDGTYRDCRILQVVWLLIEKSELLILLKELDETRYYKARILYTDKALITIALVQRQTLSTTLLLFLLCKICLLFTLFDSAICLRLVKYHCERVLSAHINKWLTVLTLYTPALVYNTSSIKEP